jgi:tRNA nucleotidyltransferase (CCA-adding enzyme)
MFDGTGYFDVGSKSFLLRNYGVSIGRDPLHAIRLIDESDLHPSVFWLPPSVERTLSASVGPRSLSLAAATILHHIAIAPILPLPEIHHSLTQEIKGSDRRDVRRRLWLAAALTPLRSLTYADKKKKHLAVEGVIREGLKVTSSLTIRSQDLFNLSASFDQFGNLNHFLTAVPALFNAADLLSLTAISPFVSPAINPSVAAKQRSDIGLLLRNKAVHQPASGTHWSYSITFALMQELIKLWDAETDTMSCMFYFVSFGVAVRLLTTFTPSAEANKCIQIFNDFAQRIDELGLAVSIDEKPRLDVSNPLKFIAIHIDCCVLKIQGRDIAAILGIKPGPQTGRILESVIEWQLQHPDGSKDACQKWVIETFGRDGAGLEGGKSRKVQEVDIVSGQSKRRRTSE